MRFRNHSTIMQPGALEGWDTMRISEAALSSSTWQSLTVNGQSRSRRVLGTTDGLNDVSDSMRGILPSYSESTFIVEEFTPQP